MSFQHDPLFIVGNPRSGTHLVRFCLSKSGELYLAPETSFFARRFAIENIFRNSRLKVNPSIIVDDIIDNSGDPTMNYIKHYRSKLYSAVEASVDQSTLARNLFESFASLDHKKRWGEKSPIHTHYIDSILQLYPDAKIIFVTRSCLNTISSIIHSSHVGYDFFEALAYYDFTQYIHQNLKNRANILTNSYEHLTYSPHQEIKSICKFANLKYSTSMCHPGMMTSSYRSQVMNISPDISISKENFSKYKRVLTPKQIEFCLFRSHIFHSLIHHPSFLFRYLIALQIRSLRTLKNKLGFFSFATRP